MVSGERASLFYFSLFCKGHYLHTHPQVQGRDAAALPRCCHPPLAPPRVAKTSSPAQCNVPSSAPAPPCSMLLHAFAIANHLTRLDQTSSIAPCANPGSPLRHLGISRRISAPALPHFSFRSCFTPAIASFRLRNNGHVGDALPTTK